MGLGEVIAKYEKEKADSKQLSAIEKGGFEIYRHRAWEMFQALVAETGLVEEDVISSTYRAVDMGDQFLVDDKVSRILVQPETEYTVNQENNPAFTSAKLRVFAFDAKSDPSDIPDVLSSAKDAKYIDAVEFHFGVRATRQNYTAVHEFLRFTQEVHEHFQLTKV